MSQALPESKPPILGPTLELLNKLEGEGLLTKPAIGGALALIYYSQPFYTDHLDVYTDAVDMTALHKRLEELGCTANGEYLNIRGVDVVLVSANASLLREALASAISMTVDGVAARIVTYEYALTVNAAAGKPSDWAEIATALEAAAPDQEKLDELLNRYDLLVSWNKWFGEPDPKPSGANADIYKAKLERRRLHAKDALEDKLVTVVMLQLRACAMANSAGRSCPRPWHSGDQALLEQIAKTDQHQSIE